MKTSWCVVERNLTTSGTVTWPYRPAVPGTAATALLNGATFVKRRDTYSPQKLLESRYEQRRRDPEKKAWSLIFTAILPLKNPSTPSSITIFIVFERDWSILVRLEIANSIHIWDHWDWIDLGIIVACYGNITMNSLVIIIMCYSPLMSE